MNVSNVPIALKKANVALMRHPETKVMAGIFVSGETRLDTSIRTACTDGWNKIYSPDYVASLTQQQVNFLVLHENLHVYLKHIPRFRKLMKSDGRLINAAMDYAINAFIMGLKDRTLCAMPEGGLYNARFDGMSVMEIYTILKQMQQDKQDKEQGKGESSDGEAGDGDAGDIGIPLDTLDDHDAEGTVVPGEGKPTDEEVMQKIDRAIQQGAILAGVLGQDVPRIVQEAMEIPVRWDDEMQEFITSSCSNRDDFSYRRLDRRWLGTDDDMMLVPTLMQENVAEIVVAADTSGSIDARAMGAWLSTLARICEAAQPDLVRVLWWDTDVKLEQTFDRSQIGEIATLARPQGGGGTRVSSVSEYIVQRGLSPDCLIVLTDGYVEGDINWQTTVPTLWTVTGARRFRPPAGRVVNIQ